MRRFVMTVVVLFLATFEIQAQTAPQSPPEILDPAVEWLNALNDLDDWSIALDGQEQGLDARVDTMMALYADHVIALVPPHDPEQIGPVMLIGKENLRKWVERIARNYVRVEWVHQRQTEGEFEGEPLVYSTPLPWGGMGIAYQIRAMYSIRDSRERFWGPGAVFLQYGEDGLIQRIRLLVAEIAPLDVQ